jgi:putative transposase
MTPIFALAAAFRSLFKVRHALFLENLALRQQLAVYTRVKKNPRLTSGDRVFWVWLSKLWDNWKAPLILVKPETVIRWHRQGFRLYWRRKSRNKEIGRPRILREHIDFIRRMSTDNPSWGEDKIFEELDVKFGIKHSTSTIRKYMVKRRPRGGQQSWKTFIKNHGDEIFACDFITQHTALFAVVYVFVVMELRTRRIVHINVTQHPSLSWVKRQVIELSGFDRSPRFLVHDNDGVFGQFGHPKMGSNGKRYRCHLDLWLDQVLNVKGIPIPYHAPNANAHVERFNRTLREDALNHFIFLDEDHVRRVVREFVNFYNGARPSQATHAIPEPYPDLQKKPPKSGSLVALPVLGGIQHDYRLAA